MDLSTEEISVVTRILTCVEKRHCRCAHVLRRFRRRERLEDASRPCRTRWSRHSRNDSRRLGLTRPEGSQGTCWIDSAADTPWGPGVRLTLRNHPRPGSRHVHLCLLGMGITGHRELLRTDNNRSCGCAHTHPSLQYTQSHLQISTGEPLCAMRRISHAFRRAGGILSGKRSETQGSS
jgi:hypothetical protein